MVIIDRKELRYSAREYLGGDLLKSFFVSFLYLLIPLFISCGVVALGVTGNAICLILGVVLSLASIVVSSGLSAGYYSYFMNIHTYAEGDVSDLFTNFSSWWGMFKVQFLMVIKVFLWSLIPVAGIFLGIKAAISYAMSPYIYLDDTTKSARECIRESKAMMMGYKSDYFLLCLSLFGWFMLNSLFLFALLLAAMFIPILGNDTLATIVQTGGMKLYGDEVGILLSNFSWMPVIFFVLFSALFMLIAMSPLYSYITMLSVEFYHALLMGDNWSPMSRNNSDQSVGEKAILVLLTAFLSIGCAVGSYFMVDNIFDNLSSGIDKIKSDREAAIEAEKKEMEAQKQKEAEEAQPDVKVDKKIVKEAKNILEYGVYSRNGLIHYMTEQGAGSEEDVTAAVDSLNIDWNEQVLSSARNYLERQEGVSEGRFLNYLDMDEFTKEEIQYALDNLHPNWQEQADIRAKNLREQQPEMTKDEMIKEMVEQEWFEEDITKKAVDVVFN